MSKPIIICVDDEPAVLDSLRRELSEEFEDGCELETAMGGVETLELVEDLLAEHCDIALVIADYLMPDLKGDEVLRCIHERSPKTLSIMLTGQAGIDGITNAINTAQLYRYIAKPWQTSDLRLTVREAINSYTQAQELLAYRQNLEQLVEARTQELTEALNRLKRTQSDLIQSEKMAALGNLVAGVAHEINTPIGNAILAASVLESETTSFTAAYGQGSLKRTLLESYLDDAQTSSQLILGNLQQAANLIQNFKQVAVDQTNLEKRTFKLLHYLKSILSNLDPQLKKTPHCVTIEADENLRLTSYPGALSQVVTNFVMNSLLHAYRSDENGHIQLSAKEKNDQIILTYSDDGCGIPVEDRSKIFDPFFTTARDRGGSGLGLHIVHNLVTQTLQGKLQLSSPKGCGTTFILTLPLTLKENGIKQ